MKGMASKIHHSNIDRNTAYSLYSSNYKPTICYPLHHTTFTDNECDKLQSPPLRALLPKMGYNRNFPRVVVHGPYALGGNQMIDLKVEQFVLQLTDLMTAVRNRDIIGEQYIFLIAAHQRFLGTSTQFFHLNFEYRLSNSRIVYLWEKLHKYDISISNKHFWIPTSDFDNDSNLMDAFLELRKRRKNTPQRITSNEIHNANEVRLYLKCTFLSDIIDENNCISLDKYEAAAPCPTHESYPNRSRPNETAIKAWQTCLQGAFITGTREVLPSLIPTPSVTPVHQEQQPLSLSAHLSSQPSPIQDVVGPMHESWSQEDIDCIRDCLEDGQDIKIYGDGTVSKGKGAHYYSIKPDICENPKYLCLHGGAKTSSNRSGLVSLRPESFSIVAALSVIHAVLSVYNITSSESRLADIPL
ncbi:hypothetical protein CTEN210_06945 [Chaetoceros tenuissimus]|uniref:Uncharacterized protein n=1 Tax=Chaetoceros tenuissimus TaxID=426638 RepID=A0AAD3CRG3_9STRA|nr:hypothetical protein CTEN210_06945 [Chaetoceros tenuissimus]